MVVAAKYIGLRLVVAALVVVVVVEVVVEAVVVEAGGAAEHLPHDLTHSGE
jgi:hypothetical protein